MKFDQVTLLSFTNLPAGSGVVGVFWAAMARSLCRSMMAQSVLVPPTSILGKGQHQLSGDTCTISSDLTLLRKLA